MKDTRLHHQPPHGSAAPLRADLIAANIFQRVAGSAINSTLLAPPHALTALAVLSFDAASAFVRESNRRDPYTGESRVPDGLPTDDEEPAATQPQRPPNWQVLVGLVPAAGD